MELSQQFNKSNIEIIKPNTDQGFGLAVFCKSFSQCPEVKKWCQMRLIKTPPTACASSNVWLQTIKEDHGQAECRLCRRSTYSSAVWCVISHEKVWVNSMLSVLLKVF